VLTLVGVENNKLAAQRVLVGCVKGVRAQGNLMLDAKEVLVRVASGWITSCKQQYLVHIWKVCVGLDVVAVGGIWMELLDGYPYSAYKSALKAQ
jgi:hypothetical protein